MCLILLVGALMLTACNQDNGQKPSDETSGTTNEGTTDNATTDTTADDTTETKHKRTFTSLVNGRSPSKRLAPKQVNK